MRLTLSAVRRLRQLPVVLRDACAVLIVLALFVAGTGLPQITIPGALLPLVPALALAAAAFGRNSALLAALLAALAVRQQWFGPTAAQANGTIGLLLMTVLLGVVLAVARLLDAWRQRRTEAVQAHAQVDATARRAAERLAMAHRDLQQAEAQLAQAEAELRAARHRPVRSRSHDLALDAAFRSEGGI